MASTPTDGRVDDPAGVDASAVDVPAVDVPAPLDDAALARVPGVLGRIATERARDYAEVDVPAPVSAPVRGQTGGADTQRSSGPLPAGRDRFAAALRAPGLSLITEIKRGSPSQGSIADLEPVDAARAYQAGGAAALSVLTEPRHFGGRLEHLREVAAASSLPAMRKEFVVHPAQLTEAAQAGAAAALLIAAVLGPRLGAYLDYAHALGLDALVEVHDEAELETALAAGAEIVGVNNRDLRTLEVDLATAPRLLRRARDAGFGGVLVAESGYAGADDLTNVAELADAALIGTALAGSGDLARAVRTLLADLAARTASAPAQPGRRPS